MTTEKVLRKSLDIFQKHWQFLALVALISFAINAVLAVIMGGSIAGGLGGIFAANSGSSVGLSSLLTAAGIASMGFGAIVTLLVMPILTGASAFAGKAALDGKTGSPVAPFQSVIKQYGSFLLLTIVLGIALGIGFTMLLIPGIILAVLLGLAPIIMAFDGANVSDALQKAWTLGLKHFWTILLTGVIIGAASFVLSLALAGIPPLSAYVGTLIATFGALALSVIYSETK